MTTRSSHHVGKNVACLGVADAAVCNGLLRHFRFGRKDWCQTSPMLFGR